MSLIDLSALRGYRTVIGSWTQIVSGILLAISQLAVVVNECAQGTIDFASCIDKIPAAALGVGIAANGLSQLGIRFAR